MKKNILSALVAASLFGCVSPKTWSGNVYEAPTDLLKRIDGSLTQIDKKLEELCPTPTPSPQP